MAVRIGFLLFSFMTFLAQAQETNHTLRIEPVPTWVVQPDTENTQLVSDERSVSYTNFTHQINLTGHQKEQFYNFSAKINHKNGIAELSEIEIGFLPDFETVNLHRISIIRGNDVIDVTHTSDVKTFQNEADIDNKMYNGSWTHFIVLNDVRQGDVIDYAYSIQGQNPVLGEKYFGGSALSWSLPLGATYFRLLTPLDSPVSTNLHNSEAEVLVKQHENHLEYLVQQHHVSAIREDEGMPPWHNPYARLSFSQYNSWEEVNEWALDLYQLNEKLPDEMKTVISALSTESKSQTAANVIQWIQDNIRYFGVEVGVNSHRPSPINETFARRYGDCKDKTMLTVAALRHLGIDAWPAFVSTQQFHMIAQELPSPGVFNHVITKLDLNGNEYWVDPTMTNQRGSLDYMSLPDFKFALVAKPETKALTPIRAIAETQRLANYTTNEHFHFAKAGEPTHISLEINYSGWKADQIRNYVASIGLEEYAENYQNYYANFIGNLEIADDATMKDIPTTNELQLLFKFTTHDYISDATNKRILSIPGAPIVEHIYLPDIYSRTSPFSYLPDLQVEQSITVELDNSLELMWSSPQDTVNISNSWFEFNRELEKNEFKINAVQKFRSKVDHVEANNFNQFVADTNAMYSSLDVKLQFPQPVKKRNKRLSKLLKKLVKDKEQ